jgi:hypothetical protein
VQALAQDLERSGIGIHRTSARPAEQLMIERYTKLTGEMPGGQPRAPAEGGKTFCPMDDRAPGASGFRFAIAGSILCPMNQGGVGA